MCPRRVRSRNLELNSAQCSTVRITHPLYRSATMRLCYLAWDRPDLQSPSKEPARWMQAPTVGDLEAVKILDWTWAADPGVCAANRGTVSCCGVHCLESCRLPENARKHVIIQTVLWFSHVTFHQHYARRWTWSSIYAQRSGS